MSAQWVLGEKSALKQVLELLSKIRFAFAGFN